MKHKGDRIAEPGGEVFDLLRFAIFLAAGLGGFSLARNFVKHRLRFVDMAQNPIVPWLAGIGAAVLAWPLAALPLITTMTSAVFGLGIGLGTRSGARAVREMDRLPARVGRY
jgi:hypothetical protein